MNDAASGLSLSEGDIASTGGDEAVVTARRVSYWYGDVLGVNDVSVDIGSGVTGLLGPNGAGKSTLLKLLSGQLKPKGGAAGLEDEAIWNNPAARSRIGLVPEHDGFYEEMTGREFVAYLTRLHGYGPARADDMAEEAIETVGLVEEQHRTISSYSKGMRQRIKFAQALAHDPEVVFLDEPLDGTDPVGRHALIELVQELGDAGKTVVVSSHVLEEVERMTSEIILIHEGRVLADGNIYEIRELIDEHPHAIIIDSPEPRTFARHLIDHDDVRKIEFEEPGLRLETDDPNACYDRIPALALEEELTLNGMTSPDNDLSSVFRYLVE